MTDTKGNGIINTIFNGYAPYKGEIAYRKLGSLIAFETGESVTYGLFSAQDRGTLFIGPGERYTPAWSSVHLPEPRISN